MVKPLNRLTCDNNVLDGHTHSNLALISQFPFHVKWRQTEKRLEMLAKKDKCACKVDQSIKCFSLIVLQL